MLTGKQPWNAKPLPPDRRRETKSYVRAAGSFVPKIAAKAFEKYGFHTAEIMTDWAKIAGGDIAKWTEPERLKWPRGPGSGGDDEGGARPGSTLVLRVDPARALEIEYKAAEIIDRINRYFGYRAVERLTLIQSPLMTKAVLASNPIAQAATEPPESPPAEVSSAPDDGLKTALTNLWASIKKR